VIISDVLMQLSIAASYHVNVRTRIRKGKNVMKLYLTIFVSVRRRTQTSLLQDYNQRHRTVTRMEITTEGLSLAVLEE
jgi:hypothetical protein